MLSSRKVGKDTKEVAVTTERLSEALQAAYQLIKPGMTLEVEIENELFTLMITKVNNLTETQAYFKPRKESFDLIISNFDDFLLAREETRQNQERLREKASPTKLMER